MESRVLSMMNSKHLPTVCIPFIVFAAFCHDLKTCCPIYQLLYFYFCFKLLDVFPKQSDLDICRNRVGD